MQNVDVYVMGKECQIFQRHHHRVPGARRSPHAPVTFAEFMSVYPGDRDSLEGICAVWRIPLVLQFVTSDQKADFQESV